MNDNFLHNSSIGVLIAAVAFAVTILLGSSIYDVAYALKRRSLLTGKNKRPKRPIISVIIYNYRRPEGTVACLESVVKSSYRKLQILVIDNASKDTSVAAVEAFIAAHPKAAIKLIAKRRYMAADKALGAAVKAAKGDIIIALTPNHMVRADALRQAADYFTATGTKALMPAVIMDEWPSLLNLWARFSNFVSLNKQKAVCLISGQGRSFRYGIFFQKKVLMRKNFNAEAIYCSDITLTYTARPSIEHMAVNSYPLISKTHDSQINIPMQTAKALKLAVVFILPVFLWYSVFVALNTRYMSLLALSWGIFTGFMILSVWAVEQLNIIRKIKYSLLATVMFGVFFVMSFIGAVGLLIKWIAKIIGIIISRILGASRFGLAQGRAKSRLKQRELPA